MLLLQVERQETVLQAGLVGAGPQVCFRKVTTRSIGSSSTNHAEFSYKGKGSRKPALLRQ